MNGIKSEMVKLLGDRREREKLFFLEKEKRGADKDKLVFIGMADIAEYYWCAMESLLKSKKMELRFFVSYLHDRISYSFRLGFINKLPKNKEKLLEVGSEITFSDIEELLKEKVKRVYVIDETKTIPDKNGNKVMVINPELPQEKRIYYEEKAKSEGIRIANPEEFPTIRGEFLESSKAEQYPTIRWNFDWNDYTVVGVPDGITDSFVYEFKTTRNKFLMSFLKPVAFTQADLYGYFFKKEKKRVQIYIKDEKKTETWENQVNRNRVLEVLGNFRKVDEGWTPPLPMTWKCKFCKFKDACKLYN
ncbi:hypothetical protein ACFLTA_08000 [Bacteroidota bacterium]